MFCQCFEFFLRQLTISPISGAAISNKSDPILFAAGIIYSLTKGIAVLPRVCSGDSKFFHVVLHVLEKQVNRMKFKSKTFIRNLMEQVKISGNSYGHKINFLPVLSLSSILILGNIFFSTAF